MNKKYYYHFTGDTLRDGRPIPPIGKWLKHRGPIIPCVSGLHASEHPYDALTYAPGSRLHRVKLRGGMEPHGCPIDKWCAGARKIVASIDAEQLLRRFARRRALDAVSKYWKDAPPVVLEYLKTGSEELRAEARDAAWAAAWAAARAAARDAAWAAARAAARDAAWDAARDAARDAAGTAARDAARAAAWDAAWDAAGTAAENAAIGQYRGWFLEMVEAEFSL